MVEKLAKQRADRAAEQGFTLVETACALLVMMIGALAMSSLFVFSLHNNVGGADRALAMGVAQQQLEQLRSVGFSDPTLVAATTTISPVVTGGRQYTVVRRIEDQTNANGTSKALKKITITVTPQSGGPGWIRSSVVLVSYRSAATMGAFAANN